MALKIRPATTLKVMLGIIAILLCANLAVVITALYFDHDYMHGLAPLLNFDNESNIPTLYSSFALIIASILLCAIGLAHKSANEPSVAWLFLAIIFLFLSIDEMASIHERLIEPLRESLNTTGLLYFAWVIPYGCILLVFVTLYLKFLWQLPKSISLLFIISGTMYVAGAIGFELLGGRHFELYGRANIGYAAYYTCEELLEMIGIALFIYTLLTYISSEFKPVVIKLEE